MSNDYQGTITRLLADLKAGNQEALEEIWQACSSELGQLARAVMTNRPKRFTDEEDVLQSVFLSLLQKKKDTFPDNRRDLWRLLLSMTFKRMATHARREMAQKRGGGRTPASLFDEIANRKPTPEDLAILSDTTERELEGLGDELQLREVALLTLDGHKPDEIANQLKMTVRAVQRRLVIIRSKWGKELGEN